MRLIISVIFVASIAVSAIAERLKLVQLIFRHGQRAPTTYITFPTDPPYLARRFPYEAGEMTNKGIAQEFNLGANLRAFYGDFVGDRYVPSQLRVLSGSDNRTIVSAQAVLATFFPPQRAQIWNDDLLWQPIAVHTEPIIDHVSFGLFNSCPSLSGKLNQTEAYFRLFRLFSPAIRELEVLTGMKIPSLYIFQKVLDAIKTRAGLEDILPLPSWANNTKFLDKIESLQNSVHGKFIDLFNEDAGGWHFDQLVARMDEAINNRTKHKAILYSGHDTNILTIGRLLNLSVINETMQDFSTYVAVELLEEDDGQHVVKFFLHNKLNGTRLPLEIAECGSPCTFERFATLRRRVTTQEWLARCTGTTLVNVGEECEVYGTVAGSLLLLVVILIGSLLSVLWTCRSYKRRYLQLADPERMPLLGADFVGTEPMAAGPRRPDGYRQLPVLKETSAGLGPNASLVRHDFEE